MAMTTDDIRRHPAYKAGFEGHRKYLESDRSAAQSYLIMIPEEFNSRNSFPGENFDPYQLWLIGAHSGMKNSNGFYNVPGGDFWKTNPEPIYHSEYRHVQLDLF